MTLWFMLLALKSGLLNLFKCIYDQSSKHVVKKDDPHLHSADTANKAHDNILTQCNEQVTSSSDSEATCTH